MVYTKDLGIISCDSQNYNIWSKHPEEAMELLYAWSTVSQNISKSPK